MIADPDLIPAIETRSETEKWRRPDGRYGTEHRIANIDVTTPCVAPPTIDRAKLTLAPGKPADSAGYSP